MGRLGCGEGEDARDGGARGESDGRGVQVIRPELLRKGFEKVTAENLAVTDDVSIVEQLPSPVKITEGEYTNIKITTPEDMPMALSILGQRREAVAK